MELQECGYDAAFVSDTPEYLRCPICHLVLRNPVFVISCGHKYCAPCYNRLEATAGTTELLCPIDRNVIDVAKVVEEAGLRRSILSLIVKCEGHEAGCSWEGPLSDLEVHAQQCSHVKEQQQQEEEGQQQPDNGQLVVMMNELHSRMDRYEKAQTYYEERLERYKECLEKKDKELIHVKMKFTEEIDTLKQRLEELERENAEIKTELGNMRKDDDRTEVQLSEEEITWLKAVVDKNNLTPAQADGPSPLLSPDSVEPKVLTVPTNPQSLVLYHGSLEEVIITDKYQLDLGKGSILFGLPLAVLSRGDKVYFEVSCTEIWEGGCSAIGWAYDIKPSTEKINELTVNGVKWYFPHAEMVYENKKNVSPYSGKYEGKNHFGPNRTQLGADYVIGVAADMTTGRLLFSWDGCWNHFSMGVAFKDLVKGSRYFPVLGGKHLTMTINLGDTKYKYEPPDKTYKKFSSLFS